MRKVRLICEDNGECEKVLPAERWPKTAEEALTLFKELLSDDGRFNGSLGLNGVHNNWSARPVYKDFSNELHSWEIVPGAYNAKIKGWRLLLVNIEERKGTVIDITDSDQAPKYAYFVVYTFSEYRYNRLGSVMAEVSCSANCEVRLNKPIQSIGDIRKIECHLDAQTAEAVSDCTVTNIILLNTPSDNMDAK